MEMVWKEKLLDDLLNQGRMQLLFGRHLVLVCLVFVFVIIHRHTKSWWLSRRMAYYYFFFSDKILSYNHLFSVETIEK